MPRSPRPEKLVNFQIPMTNELRERLRKFAEERGENSCFVVRTALRQYLTSVCPVCERNRKECGHVGKHE